MEREETIRVLQMDNLRGLLCIRRIGRILDARVRELLFGAEGGSERKA